MQVSSAPDAPSSPATGQAPNVLPPWSVHDRVHQFVIRNGHLLWRPLGSQEPWQEAHLPSKRIPLQVKADWQNLMVLDTTGDVHYAKSVRDGKSLMGRLKWRKGIWNFPVISQIFNYCIYKDPNFQVPPGGHWACSHLESGAYYLDAARRRHPLGSSRNDFTPTTTAYVADPIARCFRFYDPFMPKGPSDAGKLFIPYPETSTSTFELLGMSACRSSLLLLGYQVRPAERGVVKTLAMHYIAADANLLGLNPTTTYTYHTGEGKEFALPSSLYQTIPMPQGLLTATIGLERASGSAMDDVILTIEGVHESQPGFFQKSLHSGDWEFIPDHRRFIHPRNILASHVEDPQDVFTPYLFDYSGTTPNREHRVTLQNFGDNALVCPMTLDGEYPLMLCVKLSQWNILGYDLRNYTLVAPNRTCRHLRCDPVMPVRILSQDGGLTISKEKSREPLFLLALDEPGQKP